MPMAHATTDANVWPVLAVIPTAYTDEAYAGYILESWAPQKYTWFFCIFIVLLWNVGLSIPLRSGCSRLKSDL